MRKAKGMAAIFAGLLLMFRAGAITVSADEGKNGNNGDVKIHEVGTAQADNRNEPHVCAFYVDAFKFDAGSTVTFHIDKWAPTGSGQVAAGAIHTDSKGNGRSADQTLPSGHYKLFAKQTAPATPGGDKQKVFWVECGTAANGQGNVPPTTPGQQNNGSNGNEKSDQPTQSKSKAGGSKSGTNSKSKKGGSASGTNSASKGTKGGTQAGSVTGTHSVSKGGTKAGGTKGTNGGSVASQGNNASGTNSMQTVSREESTTPATTPAPVVIPSGGTTLPNAVTLPVTTPVVEGAITIPAGAVITLPAGTSITLPNGTVLTGRIPTGTTLPAGTVLPAGTTITGTGVLGFESAPAMTGAVTPELENTAAAASQSTAVNGEQTSPVAGVTSLPSTSTTLDNGIWGALGLMLAGLGAFLLRKPSRRLN